MSRGGTHLRSPRPHLCSPRPQHLLELLAEVNVCLRGEFSTVAEFLAAPSKQEVRESGADLHIGTFAPNQPFDLFARSSCVGSLRAFC